MQISKARLTPTQITKFACIEVLISKTSLQLPKSEYKYDGLIRGKQMAPQIIEMSRGAIMKQCAGCLVAFGFPISLDIKQSRGGDLDEIRMAAGKGINESIVRIAKSDFSAPRALCRPEPGIQRVIRESSEPPQNC